jgi:hypothetical protein
VPLGLAELGGQKRLDEIPGHRRSHGSSAHAKDVHVIVLDALLGREMVVDKSTVVGGNSYAHRLSDLLRLVHFLLRAVLPMDVHEVTLGDLHERAHRLEQVPGAEGLAVRKFC